MAAQPKLHREEDLGRDGRCPTLRADEAKAFFRQLDDHSIYPSLVQTATKLFGSSPDDALKRFREIDRKVYAEVARYQSCFRELVGA